MTTIAPGGPRFDALVAADESLPHRLFTDLCVGLLAVSLIGTFLLLAQAYAATQPMLLLVMPIPLATALIVLTLVHDRRVSRTRELVDVRPSREASP